MIGAWILALGLVTPRSLQPVARDTAEPSVDGPDRTVGDKYSLCLTGFF